MKNFYEKGYANNNNPIEDELKNDNFDAVFIQWGIEERKEKKFAKDEFNKIRKLCEINFKTKSLELTNEKNMHPRRWSMLDKKLGYTLIEEFKKQVDNIIKN